jgi:Tol biopolymer transport system component
MGAQAQGIVIRAVTPDGEAVPMPDLGITSLGITYRFLPDGSAMVVMRGIGVDSSRVRNANFWRVDLATGQTRQLTDLAPGYDSSTFDVSADGRQIVFDRHRENSDIVLIELR